MSAAAWARELATLIAQALADHGTVLSPADQTVMADTIRANARVVLMAGSDPE